MTRTSDPETVEVLYFLGRPVTAGEPMTEPLVRYITRLFYENQRLRSERDAATVRELEALAGLRRNP